MRVLRGFARVKGCVELETFFFFSIPSVGLKGAQFGFRV